MKRCWGSDLLMVSSAPPRFVMEEMLPTHGSGEADAFLCAVTDVACAPPPPAQSPDAVSCPTRPHYSKLP